MFAKRSVFDVWQICKYASDFDRPSSYFPKLVPGNQLLFSKFASLVSLLKIISFQVILNDFTKLWVNSHNTYYIQNVLLASYKSWKLLLKHSEVLQQNFRLLSESCIKDGFRNSATCDMKLFAKIVQGCKITDLDVRCGRVRNPASVYLISIFCSC